jgi:hypothetical protein
VVTMMTKHVLRRYSDYYYCIVSWKSTEGLIEKQLKMNRISTLVL